MGVTASKSTVVQDVSAAVQDVSAASVVVASVVDVSAAPVVQDVSAAPAAIVEDVSASVVSDVSDSPSPVSAPEIKKSRSCGLCCSKSAVAIVTSDKAEADVSQSPEQTSEKNPEPTAV